MRISLRRWPILGSFCLLLSLTLASPGDDLIAFDDCLYQCRENVCYKNSYHTFQEEFRTQLEILGDYEFRYHNADWSFVHGPEMPWHLWVLGWNCELNCDYECQRIITRERAMRGQEIYQFHGKWPFLRVAGIQEPASVVFSLGNLLVNYRAMKKLAGVYEKHKNASGASTTIYNTWLVTLVSVMAWFCSTIFHVRDYLFTEHLDYYFAGLTVLTSFHAIAARVFHLYEPRKAFARRVFSSCCIAAYAAHVYRLLTDWLYTYNMQVNIAVGVGQSILVTYLCYTLYSKYYTAQVLSPNANLSHLKYIDRSRLVLPLFFAKSPKVFSLYPLMMTIIVSAGMMLEIFDFPPIMDLFDAHSLWHLATIVPPFMGWYDWVIWDALENVGEDVAAQIAKKEM